MPSGPSKVGACFGMPHEQVQRLKAALTYHPLSRSEDPEHREWYNFQKMLDQLLNDEDVVLGCLVLLAARLYYRVHKPCSAP
jgi:hypothetical protein